MSVGRSFRWFVALAGAAVLVAGCAPLAPPAPAPLIQCDHVAGDITYTPPATNSGEDITIATDPVASLTGCTDHTGAGITSGDLELSLLLPAYLCTQLDMGAPVGSGGGAIRWSDGSTSTVTAQVFGGSSRSFVTELTITGGRWRQALGSVSMYVTTADGYCTAAQPVTHAHLTSDAPIAFHAPVAPLLAARTDIAQVDTGGSSCAVMTNHTVTCWGDNSHGQLGNLLFGPGSQSSLPVPVTGVSGAVEVGVGGDHACARSSTGTVRCWGNNANGRLGNGTTVSSNVSVPVTGLTGVRQLSVGYPQTCALLADATVSCWGYATGPGGTDSPTPVPVAGLSGVVQLAGGSSHQCALLGNGAVRCWGDNQFGQLGDGSTTTSLTPVAVLGLPPVQQITAGSEHSCALDASGEVWCWGFNRYGELGRGYAGETPGTTPARVLGQLHAAAIDGGGANTCALLTGGSVACWGANGEGSLGTGTTLDSSRPMLVLGLRGAGQVSAGGHACAVLPGGRASCWGDNRSGQLGTGLRTSSAVPLPVVG